MQLTRNTSGIILDGKEGTWEVFDQIMEMGELIYLLQDTKLRDLADYVAVNEDGKIVSDGFFDREEDPRYQEDIKKYFAERGIKYRRIKDGGEDLSYPMVYPFGFLYAADHDEIEKYSQSRKLNIECRNKLENAFSIQIDHPDPYAFLPAVEKYGTDRVAFVLSATVLLKKRKDDIPKSVRKWASKRMEDMDSREYGSYAVSCSADILSIYVELFQIYLLDRQIEESLQMIEALTD